MFGFFFRGFKIVGGTTRSTSVIGIHLSKVRNKHGETHLSLKDGSIDIERNKLSSKTAGYWISIRQ